MLSLKFVTGAIAIPVVLLFLYLGGWPLMLFATAFMLIGLHELYSSLPASPASSSSRWSRSSAAARAPR